MLCFALFKLVKFVANFKKEPKNTDGSKKGEICMYNTILNLFYVILWLCIFDVYFCSLTFLPAFQKYNQKFYQKHFFNNE